MIKLDLTPTPGVSFWKRFRCLSVAIPELSLFEAIRLAFKTRKKRLIVISNTHNESKNQIVTIDMILNICIGYYFTTRSDVGILPNLSKYSLFKRVNYRYDIYVEK